MAKKCEQCGGVHAKAYERCPECPTPPLAHGPDHAQARALALQVVPPTAYHAQFSVEQRAAYNLARAYLALAPQPSVPSGEAVGWRVDFPDGKKAFCVSHPTEYESFASVRITPLYAAPPQERVSEAMVEAGLKAKDGYAVFGAVYGVGEREVMRRILTAALSAGREDV